EFRRVLFRSIHFFGSIHFDSCKSGVSFFLRSSTDILWPITADPRINLDVMTDSSAEHFIDWHIVILAFNVPECLFNPGNSTHQDWTASIKATAIYNMQIDSII